MLGGDHWDGVPVLGAQPSEHVEDLRSFTNWLADIAQGISQALELAGVGGDVHIALDDAPELRL
jgi:hypothetical protein